MSDDKLKKYNELLKKHKEAVNYSNAAYFFDYARIVRDKTNALNKDWYVITKSDIDSSEHKDFIKFLKDNNIAAKKNGPYIYLDQNKVNNTLKSISPELFGIELDSIDAQQKKVSFKNSRIKYNTYDELTQFRKENFTNGHYYNINGKDYVYNSKKDEFFDENNKKFNEGDDFDLKNANEIKYSRSPEEKNVPKNKNSETKKREDAENSKEIVTSTKAKENALVENAKTEANKETKNTSESVKKTNIDVKTYTGSKDAGFLKYLQQMRVVAESESGYNYNPIQSKDKSGKPLSSAFGKYQYLWDTWGTEMLEKAKEWGYDNIESKEDILKNHEFQEKWFEFDQARTFEEAKKLSQGENPLKISTIDAGFLIHFQGKTGAKNIVTTGKHKPATYKKDGTLENPGTDSYLNTFRNNLKKAGLHDNLGKEYNVSRANALSDEEKLKVQENYQKQVNGINKLNAIPLEKNIMLNELAEQFFNDGNLEIVNRKLDFQNKQKIEAQKRLKSLTSALSNKNFQKSQLDKDGYPIGNITLKNEKGEDYTVNINEEINYINNYLDDENKIDLKKDFEVGESNILKRSPSGSVKDGNYETPKPDPNYKKLNFKRPNKYKVSLNTRFDLNSFSDDSFIQSTETNKEENNNETKKENPNVDTTVSQNDAYLESLKHQEKQLQDPLESYRAAEDGWQPDKTFNYEAGNFELPLEGMAGLAMGIAGMNAANDPMPARDEMVSSAMMDYASNLKKISQMGLPPEVEGDLNDKLASAYQTGLTNIVRASAGNRNLVLGNQGQLDQARMSGIMEMALMDVDRRDKAMAAYGEVMQYINEFDSRRDVANNERKYREAEKRQASGMALASAGFQKLMDELAYQREQGPGSPGDMMNQYVLQSIYGYNPKMKDNGEGTVPGTKSYADRLASERKESRDSKKAYGNYLSTLSKEERNKVAKILEEKPNVNPMRSNNPIKALEELKQRVHGAFDDEGNQLAILDQSDLDDDGSNVEAFPNLGNQVQKQKNDDKNEGIHHLNDLGMPLTKNPEVLAEAVNPVQETPKPNQTYENGIGSGLTGAQAALIAKEKNATAVETPKEKNIEIYEDPLAAEANRKAEEAIEKAQKGLASAEQYFNNQ